MAFKTGSMNRSQQFRSGLVIGSYTVNFSFLALTRGMSTPALT